MIIVPITGLLWEIKNPLGRRAEKVLKTSFGNEPSRLRVLRAKKELFLFFVQFYSTQVASHFY